MLHQIGSGVLGPVFRTYDPQADKLVAVKVFRLDLLPEDVARLADGLRRLIGAPGVVAAGLENTSAYLAIDYLGGESLDVAMRHLAPAPLDKALPILERAAALIDVAWEGGFGHGALHPRDIFVTPDTNEVAMTGFGVVPALEALNSSGAKAPVRRPYTAPERATGEGWDIRADIYSLAAIAHELLTGRRPAGPSEQDGTLPASMSPEMRVHVRRVLSKALAESPAQRFATAGEFVAALGDQNALPEPVVLTPSAAPTPVPPPTAEPVALTLLPVLDEADVLRKKAHDEFDLSHVIRQDSEQVAALIAPPAPATPPASNRRAKSGTVAMPVARPHSKPVLSLNTPAAEPPAEPRFRSVEPELVRTPAADFAMPPPTPWGVVIAVGVACLILGAAIDHQWMLSSFARASEDKSRVTAPAPDGPAAKPAEKAPAESKDAGRSDTEVAVSDPAPAGSSSAKAPPAVLPGKITVRSAPAGALVTIDGKPAGRTPLTAPASLAGHSVVIARPGFASETRRVVLSRRAPATTVSVTLKAAGRAASSAPAAATGSVSIDSRPRGARITIDGRALGQSPSSVPGLSPGRHALRLELNGYKPLDTTFTVKAGETARVAVTLEIR